MERRQQQIVSLTPEQVLMGCPFPGGTTVVRMFVEGYNDPISYSFGGSGDLYVVIEHPVAVWVNEGQPLMVERYDEFCARVDNLMEVAG